MNLWCLDDLCLLVCCFFVTVGTVLMASSMKSEGHPPCVTAWHEGRRHTESFDIGLATSSAAQLVVLAQAAIFEPRARDHVAVQALGLASRLLVLWPLGAGRAQKSHSFLDSCIIYVICILLGEFYKHFIYIIVYSSRASKFYIFGGYVGLKGVFFHPFDRLDMSRLQSRASSNGHPRLVPGFLQPGRRQPRIRHCAGL